MNSYVFFARVLAYRLSGAPVCPRLSPSWSSPVESSRLPRLRHRRAAQTTVLLVVSPPHPRRVESRRLCRGVPGARPKAAGAPKRVNTDGYACPNQPCAYFGITNAHIHALVGDGKHGQAERNQTFRGPACRTTFTRPSQHTPIPSENPFSCPIAMVLSALAEELDPSAAERVFGFRHATITAWLWRAGEHSQSLHERTFSHLQLPHLQLDELRTRLRNAKQVLWLWLAIDPCTKLVPVLHLGPRTQHAAHLFIHSLRQMLAPGCLPLFTSDGFWYFYASRTPFWRLARR